MSLITVKDLSFSYDTACDMIFENVSFQIDTDWKLGFIGRNGRGKTTFLNLLMGKYEYRGSITASVDFDYFPFVTEHENRNTMEVIKDIIAPFKEWEKEMGECLKKYKSDSYYINRYGELQELYEVRQYIMRTNRKGLGKLQVDYQFLQDIFHFKLWRTYKDNACIIVSEKNNFY